MTMSKAHAFGPAYAAYRHRCYAPPPQPAVDARCIDSSAIRERLAFASTDSKRTPRRRGLSISTPPPPGGNRI